MPKEYDNLDDFNSEEDNSDNWGGKYDSGGWGKEEELDFEDSSG